MLVSVVLPTDDVENKDAVHPRPHLYSLAASQVDEVQLAVLHVSRGRICTRDMHLQH